MMRKKMAHFYRESALATKIRFSYLLILIPMVLFLFFCFFNLWEGNRKYEDMIQSAVVASDFSLDFKSDFDYETYLLIVGNKSLDESKLNDLLSEANRIVNELEDLTESEINTARLESAKKYLNKLEIYKSRIESNLAEENRYEDNIEIWENDVQIVTSLLEETISQYIYYEIRDIQQARSENRAFYMDMLRISLITFAVLVVVISFLSYFIPQSITRPIRELSVVTDQVARGDLEVRAKGNSGAEVGVLSDSLNTMIDKINELLTQVKEEQIRLRKAEFELLQSQINPHFLYNTLDTIIWLAEAGDQKQVVSMVGSLSDFFRASLNQGKEVVSLKEELQHVRSYLEIQQVRYQDILEYEISVPTELETYQIPKITIQPLVENALYHGIKNKRGKGKITVTGEVGQDIYILRITDNGIGMTEERLQQVSEGIRQHKPRENDIYGMINVNERIRLGFGEQYGITVESVYMEGSCVTVTLPQIQAEQEVL